MANSLFIVDSPPLLDPHSEAKMVTCTLRDLSEKDIISKHDQNGYTPKRKQNIKNDYKKFITISVQMVTSCCALTSYVQDFKLMRFMPLIIDITKCSLALILA